MAKDNLLSSGGGGGTETDAVVGAVTGIVKSDGAGNISAAGAGDGDAIVTDATTSAKGKVELAIASEVNTGTDATRAVTPDSLAGSNYGTRVFSILINDATALTSGDGKAYFRVPDEINGWNLVGVRSSRLSGTGVPSFQIHNLTQTADMLSTNSTIETGETDSKDAAAQAVIDATNDDVATGDRIRIDVDDAGTNTLWAEVQLAFRAP